MIKESISMEIRSPIHIGTGNKITKLDYILEGRNIVVYSFEKLLSFLDEKTLNYIVFELERGRRIGEDLIRKYLNGTKKYSVRLNFHSFNQHKDIHEFVKTIKDKQYKPYIPASEIKGAIRTAVLYKILKDYWKDLKDIVCKEKNGKIFLKSKAAKQLENKIFGDIKNDIMKFFIVDDSQPLLETNLTVEEIKIVNGRRNFTEYAECLNGGTSNFSISILEENPGLKKYRYYNYLINWKNCCYEYAKDIIEVEKDYWNNKNQTIYEYLKVLERQNSNENPLIRLGRFTGKLSHTIVVLLKIKNLNVDRKIFPKTRRITVNSEMLGWVKI